KRASKLYQRRFTMKQYILLAVIAMSLICPNLADADLLAVVTSTTVSGNILTITGAGFGGGPKVTVGGAALTITSASATKIVAAFPVASPVSSFTPGDYLLTI